MIRFMIANKHVLYLHDSLTFESIKSTRPPQYIYYKEKFSYGNANSGGHNNGVQVGKLDSRPGDGRRR